MLFSSTLFLFLFLPAVLGAYFALNPPLRNGFLLLASLAFYAFGERFFVFLMLASIVANWAFGLWIAAERRRGRGRLPLALAVGFDLALLVAFKYADWLLALASSALLALGTIDVALPALGTSLAGSSWHPLLVDPDGGIHLPIGISFFTFQAISYVVDVYRGEAEARRDPLDVALYVSLFPQLIAGPIVRYRDVAAQIVSRHVDLASFASGVRRFTLGLGKKVLIANTLAAVADDVFAIPVAELPPATAWLGLACYTLQIYFDFSGYSDMAIGLGRMFGFRFLENFLHPYASRSVTEFWRRWHVSLSTWFRDYLYIPLGGNRRGAARTAFHLIVVFALCGLWHGASATFLLWGLLHGAFLGIERAGLLARLERLHAAPRHLYLLLAVMAGWVLFRAPDLPHALGYYQALAFGQSGDALRHAPGHWLEIPVVLALVCGAIGSTPWLAAAANRVETLAAAGRRLPWLLAHSAATGALAIVFLLAAMRLAAGTYNPFIYFRF
jgi:alginate O-acetyltransferase complex protein AlgI